MAAPDPVHERRALTRSIAASTALGLRGIGWGLAAGSQLIVLEGARADHMGCYGYGRETTPFLDQVAR